MRVTTSSDTLTYDRPIGSAFYPFLVAASLLYALFCIVAPLAVYTLTLALFGLPHVLSELRFVDRRFSRRLGGAILWRILPLLGLIVLSRTSLVFHLLPSHIEVPVELGLVALLALAVAQGPPARIFVAVAIGLVIGGAAAIAPYDTAVIFSVLHNLTPLGFLWQIAPLRYRPPIMATAFLSFLGLPLFVATGLPRLAVAGFVGSATGLDPLGAGPLAQHLYVYVPGIWAATPHAIDFFTASVVAQGAHYFAVILILPLLLARLEPGARGLVSWPQGAWFALACAGVAVTGLAFFAGAFAQSRAVYGILASVHAWIEIPVLIFALTGGSQIMKTPIKQDAVFATSETIIAR